MRHLTIRPHYRHFAAYHSGRRKSMCSHHLDQISDKPRSLAGAPHTHLRAVTSAGIVAVAVVHKGTRGRKFITAPTIRRIRRGEDRLIDSHTLLLAVARGLVGPGVGEGQARAGGETSLVCHRLDRQSAIRRLGHRVGRGIDGRQQRGGRDRHQREWGLHTDCCCCSCGCGGC